MIEQLQNSYALAKNKIKNKQMHDVYFQEVFASTHEIMMTEAKSEAHVLNIIHIYQFYFFIFTQKNLTLRETECRFKTYMYMSLLYTNTRRKSL